MDEDILMLWWTKLLAYARTKPTLHSMNAPDRWALDKGRPSGVSGIDFAYSYKQHAQLLRELRIDRKSTEENKEVFDRLIVDKHEIELTVGRRLD